MSKSIEIKKLKKMLYLTLRWRLQIPNYYPHNPIPEYDKLSNFSQGLVCAYRDILKQVEEIEKSQNQRRLWKADKKSTMYEDSFLEEIRNNYGH